MSEPIINNTNTNTITNTIYSDSTTDNAKEHDNEYNKIGFDIDKAVETDVLLREDLVLRYLDLVTPEDKYLLNLPYIHETGENYINNWRTGIYIDYVQAFSNLISKYASRKKYYIRSSKTAITVFKSESSTNTSNSQHDNNEKHKVIDKVDKPIFMELDNALFKGNDAMQTQRAATKMQYEHLLSKSYIDEKDKNKFNKQREQFISTLNAFYSVQYYSNKINNHMTTNISVPVPIVSNKQHHLKTTSTPRISSLYINVSPNFIDSLFQREGEKLELYNRIIELQSSMDLESKEDMAELTSLIKSYILYDTQNDTMKHLNKELKKLKEYKPIHWLIVANSTDRPDFCKKTIPFIFTKSTHHNK